MVERGADGKFWMTIEDFKLHFSNFSVCMTVDDYKYSYVSLTQEGNGLNDMNCLSFEIKKKGEYTFSAIQRDDREFPIDSDYGYSPTKMCLAKGNSLDELMIKKGKFFLWKRDSNLCFDNLEPGKYFLFVQ